MPGRCEGCGRTGSPCKIKTHAVECADYLALPFPDQLDPEASYARWVAEGKPAERQQRRQDLADREVVLRSAQDLRWATPKDILED